MTNKIFLFQVPRTRFIILTGVKVLALTLENHVWKMAIWDPFLYVRCPTAPSTGRCCSISRASSCSHTICVNYTSSPSSRLGITYFKINERRYCGPDDEPPTPIYTFRALSISKKSYFAAAIDYNIFTNPRCLRSFFIFLCGVTELFDCSQDTTCKFYPSLLGLIGYLHSTHTLFISIYYR